MFLRSPALRLAPLLLSLSLAGCAGQAEQSSNAYLLPETPAGQHHDARLSVTIAPVTMTDFLKGDGIVMQLDAIQVHQARHHLWAEGLPGQLRQSLIHRLGSALPQAQIIVRGQPQLNAVTGREVRLQLDRFQGRFDGIALVRGHWQILDEQKQLLQERSFTVETPLNEDGYPELVRALATGWEQVADELAAALANSAQVLP